MRDRDEGGETEREVQGPGVRCLTAGVRDEGGYVVYAPVSECRV